jgi:O-antigen ligase
MEIILSERNRENLYTWSLFAIFTLLAIGMTTTIVRRASGILNMLDEGIGLIWVPVLVVLFLGAVWLTLAVYAQPWRAAVAIALVLPFESIPFLGGIGPDDLDLITPVILLVLVATTARILLGKFAFYRTGLELPIALFLLSALFAAGLSFRPLFTVFTYIKYAKVFVLLFVFYAVLRKAEERQIRLTLLAYLASASFVFIFSIIMYVARLLLGFTSTFVTISPAGTLRLMATLKDPNIAAAYLVPAVLLALYWTLQSRVGHRRMLFATIFVFLGSSLVLTASRSGVLAMVFALLFWLFWEKRFLVRKRSVVIALVFLFVLFIVVALVIPGIRDRTFTQVSSIFDRLSGSSFDARASNDMHSLMGEWAFDMFKQQPWGVGRWNLAYEIGLDRLRMFRYSSIEQILAEGPPVHNSWLEILSSEGLGGLVAFIWIIGIVLREDLRTFKIKNDVPFLGELKALAAGFIGILVSMFFYTYDWMYFPWFLIALQLILSLRTRENYSMLANPVHA